MEKVEKFVGSVQMSLHLLSTALDELLAINEEKKDPKEAHLMKLPPFKFYRISLQYMIIMELTKLLEPDTKERKNFRKGTTWEDIENTHSASLAKNSRMIYELKGEIFEKEFENNKDQLEEIWTSDYYKKLKDDRDKKFAHADADYSGDIYGIRTYSESEIDQAKYVLSQIEEIFKRCTGAFGDYEFHFDLPDGRTRNFIDYHMVYESYYSINIKKAISEGYSINHKREGKMPTKN